MRIQAFQGLRPNPAIAAQLASLPYDVVSTEEARELAKGNPLSFLHVVRAEIDLPVYADPYADATYLKAKENFEALQRDGHLIRETEPCLFLYRQIWRGRAQVGLTATVHIEDYENNVIKKHEKTRIQKENDRLKLNQTINAHPGPAFLTYREDAHITALCEKVAQEKPLYDFVAVDEVRHTLWRIPGGAEFVSAFKDIPCAYIADGHHRSASAYRLGKARREANPNHTGNEPYNWYPAVLFPSSQLAILPYNRLVKDLNGLSPVDFMNRVKQVCTVYENNAATPEMPGQISLFIRDRWFGLVRPKEANLDPISSLDVSFLQDKILHPILGIEDPRVSPRIDFVGGIRGVQELEKRVTSGEFALAFSMYPATLDQLLEISDADQIMPPKSTWFEPKLRSGLFVHTV